MGDVAATHALAGSVARPMERETSKNSPRALEVSDDMLGITYVPPGGIKDNGLPLGMKMSVELWSYRSVEAFTPILETSRNGAGKCLIDD